MQGDIMFFEANDPPSLFERLISFFSQSKIVHVGIDVGDNTMVEALSAGIVMHTIGTRKFLRWEYAKGTTDSDPKDMQEAVTWIKSMVGQKYGWSDIGTAINMFSHVLYLVSPEHYDCSALGTEFLDKAGGVDLKGLELDAHVATPKKLFDTLGMKEP